MVYVYPKTIDCEYIKSWILLILFLMKGLKRFLYGAGMLAVSGLISKLIGAVYRIPLTNVIGAEGIGLYQMVFPLYTVLLTVSSGGLPTAISKVVSSSGDAQARRVLKISLISLAVVGGLSSLLIVLLKDFIAGVQGNPLAALAYMGIAPSVFLVAIIACFRGYYQGKQNMLPSSLSTLTEQVFKLVFGLLFSYLLLPYGVTYAVFGAVAGVTLSELAAALQLIVTYYFTDRKFRRSKFVSLSRQSALSFETAIDIASETKKQTTREILLSIYKVAIPVTLGSLVLPVTQVIDSILVINMLVSFGYTRRDATSMFGVINGPIGSLINMPIAVTLSFAIALLPKISNLRKNHRGEDVPQAILNCLKFSWFIAFAAFLALFAFSEEIISLLYKRGLNEMQIRAGSVLLKLGSISVVYVSIIQIAASVLQAYDKAVKPAVNLMIGAVVKVVCTLVFLNFFDIYGVMMATVVCYSVTAVLDIISMRKCITLSPDKIAFIVAPVTAGIGMVLASRSLFNILQAYLAPSHAFIAGGIVGIVLYAVLIIATGGLAGAELYGIPVIGNYFKKRDEKRRRLY